jgi:hypothetical protein
MIRLTNPLADAHRNPTCVTGDSQCDATRTRKLRRLGGLAALGAASAIQATIS